MKRVCTIIIFCLSINGVFANFDQNLQFEHLTTADGLSHNQINSIFQDESGFIWFGTLHGLNRYDGYEIQSFFHEPENPNSLLNNSVLNIAKGPDETMWIFTGEGISIYHPELSLFTSTDHFEQLLQVESGDIIDILVDDDGNAWFMIDNQGVVKLSKGSDKPVKFADTDAADVTIASNLVSEMIEGPEGNIWFIHQKGHVEVVNRESNEILKSFHLKGDVFDKAKWLNAYVDSDMDLWVYCADEPFGLYYLNTSNDEYHIYGEAQINSSIVRKVIRDKRGQFWVGTDHGGISIINKKNGQIETIKNDPNNDQSLGNNSVNAMIIDNRGIIWVGTTKNGISYLHHSINDFRHYKYPGEDPEYNDIGSIVEDEKGNFYIGTNGRGILYFDRKVETFQQIRLHEKNKEETDIIVSLLYDKNNTLWIGTYLDGLKKYRDGIVTTFKPHPGENSVSESSIWELLEDSEGNIWIGTLKSGVDKYDPLSGAFANFDMDDGIINNYVPCMAEDKQGNIWVGTGQGLTVYEKDKATFKGFLTTDSIENPITNNSVIALESDSQGRVWIGTLGGLNLYDPGTGGFEYFLEKDGLSSNIIISIQDYFGNIWVATAKGITKLSFKNGDPVFQTFDASDGLQDDNFNEGANLITRDSLIVFAGQDGFNIFDPSKVNINETPPVVNFTGFYVSNKQVKPHEKINGRVILNKGINYTDRLNLKYSENSFTVEFAALTYFQPQKNKYLYKLEGFDEDWIQVSSDIRRANYTNLDYGDYVLHVKAANNHNVWNEEGIQLAISISPPFWKTPLAYVLYFLIISGALFLTRRIILERERLKTKVANERFEAHRLHELDLMKIKFFTNISHEFKTPLSLILTPIDRMIKSTEDERKLNEFNLIKRNAKRLLTLVNQLLDFRKMEANQHVLSQSNGDLVGFLRETIDSFSDLAQERNITITFESSEEQFITLFDKDKMEKIIFNLISNSIKFTKPGGSICVGLDKKSSAEGDNLILLRVKDTGIGIPKSKLPTIFNRFIQSDMPVNMINNGTGIGLSITKEFVDLHGGNISVQSEVNQATTFTIELPLPDISENPQLSPEPIDRASADIVLTHENKNKYTILLVEDNLDFRFYLKDNLKQHFNIREAGNGKEAWKSILDSSPDIIISDVMMPVMDGLELTKKVKKDPRSSDIPVILLTAQSSDTHKIEGLETGAIEYISKPFNFEILKSSINTALKFRKHVEDAGKKLEATPSEIAISSLDEKLINKALQMVEENISNPEFTVEHLSRELGYSRGHFYKKILEITGITPLDFIRDIKMKRAADLLKRSQLNVSEVAFMVGYNNPKLFSKYFKAKYKVYPSKFIKFHADRSR